MFYVCVLPVMVNNWWCVVIVYLIVLFWVIWLRICGLLDVLCWLCKDVCFLFVGCLLAVVLCLAWVIGGELLIGVL